MRELNFAKTLTVIEREDNNPGIIIIYFKVIYNKILEQSGFVGTFVGSPDTRPDRRVKAQQPSSCLNIQ